MLISARTWVSFPGPEHPRRAHLPAPVDRGDGGRLRPQSEPPLQPQMFPDDKTPGNLAHGTLSFLWNDTFPRIPHCYSFIAAPRRAQTTVPPDWLPRPDRDGREPIRALEYYMCVISQCRIFLGGPVQVFEVRLVETKTNTGGRLITLPSPCLRFKNWFVRSCEEIQPWFVMSNFWFVSFFNDVKTRILRELWQMTFNVLIY